MTILNPQGLSLSIPYTDVLIEGPAIEPIDLEETKKALKITPTSEDTLIDLWIAAARQYWERQTGRPVISSLWERRLAGFPTGFPHILELPKAPAIEVVSVGYTDGDGADVVLDPDTYTVDLPSGDHAAPGTIRLVSGTWPATIGSLGSARARYRAGYGEQRGDVPELVRAALYMLVGHFYRFRAPVQQLDAGRRLEGLPLGIEQLILEYKYSALPRYPPMRLAV